MRLIAARRGEYPIGVHWTAGEVREVDVVEYPEWLAPFPELGPRKPRRKPKPTDTADDSEG